MSIPKKKIKDWVFTIVFMIATTIIFVTPISLFYVSTKERVKLNEEFALKKAVLYASGIELPQKPNAMEVEKLFASQIRQVKDETGKVKYYEATAPGKPGEVISYIFVHSGVGLWGKIVAVVGLDKDLKKVTGIEFIQHTETPGLGARMDETWFKEQFRGKTGPFKKTVAEKSEAKSDEFQAITGATITTDGIKKILNGTYDEAPKLVEGKK